MLKLKFLSRRCRDGKFAVLAILVTLIVSISFLSYAEEKPLRVAMWGEYMPLHGFVNGKAVGIEADMARELGKAMNRQVIFVDARSKGMSSIDAVARGEADIALNAVTPTAERAKLVGFTKPYVTLQYRVLSKPGKRLTSIQDLSRSKVVAPNGPAFTALRQLVGDKAISASSLNAAIELLKKSEVDFVFGEDIGLISVAQGTDFILNSQQLGKSPVAAVVPKTEVKNYNERLRSIQVLFSDLTAKWQSSANLKRPTLKWIDLLTDEMNSWALDVQRTAHACEKENSKKFQACLREKTPDWQEMRSWTIPLYAGPSKQSARLGEIRITGKIHEGFMMSYIGQENGDTVFDPDDRLSYRETEFRPHTILEERGGWVLLPKNPFPTEVWVEKMEHRVWDVRNDMYVFGEHDIIILDISDTGIVAREESPTGYSCGDVKQKPEDGIRTFIIPWSELYDENGHLRLKADETIC